MMHGMSDLYSELHRTHLEINKQIDAVKEFAERQTDIFGIPKDEAPDPTRVYRLQNRDGSFLLTDLLSAKAQCLGAMAALKAADVNSKSPRR